MICLTCPVCSESVEADELIFRSAGEDAECPECGSISPREDWV
jgi:uncharacterized Zn finger protein